MNKNLYIPIAIVAFVFLIQGPTCVSVSKAADYYVATTGNDTTGDGSIGTPWKTIQYGTDQLSAGDTLHVRGGVYQEAVYLNCQGSSGSPVTIKAYTGETPILIGTVDITGWTQCVSDEPGLTVQSVTNPNYANIYRADFSADYFNGGKTYLYEDGSVLFAAREPNQTNAEGYQPTLGYSFTAESEGLTTYMVDSTAGRPPTKADDYWLGSYMDIWLHNNNSTVEVLNGTAYKYPYVTDNNQADTTITFSDTLSAAITATGVADTYSMRNHPHILNKAGEYYFTTTPDVNNNHQMYVWPLDANDIETSMTIPGLSRAFYKYEVHNFYIVIDGFEITGYTGTAILLKTYLPTEIEGTTIKNCNVHDVRGTGIQLTYAEACTIQDNTVERVGNYGVRVVGGTSHTITGNTIDDAESTVLSIVGCDDTRMLSNHLGGSSGSHGSAFTFYQVFPLNGNPGNSKRNLFAYNYVNRDGGALNYSGDLVVYANAFARNSNQVRFQSAPYPTDEPNIVFVNNILGSGITLYDGGNYHMYNNMVGYWNSYFPKYYTTLARNNNAYRGGIPYTYEANEFPIDDATWLNDYVDSNLADIADFKLSEGSQLVGQGTNIIPILEAIGVVDTVTPANDWFVGFDFTKDANDDTWNDPPSIGAYEYGVSTPGGNGPPVLDAIGNKTVNAWDTLTITASATDPDGDSMSYTWKNVTPSSPHLTTSGTSFVWKTTHNDAANSPYSITCEVIDEYGNKDSETFTVTITDRRGYILTF